MQVNYFVCTLGQAAHLNDQPKPYRTVSEFVIQQAQHHPQLPAVGFPIPEQGPNGWFYKVLTFADVDRGSNAFALRLSAVLKSPSTSETIALLCHSSPEFLFTWLGLMRLGHPVLLIAPQCQPAAIVHLCASCQVSVLFFDAAHAERAHQAGRHAKEQGETHLTLQLLPLRETEDIFQLIHEHVERKVEPPHLDRADTAYLHHTSGTSSGLPKPIPQSHGGAIGVLPNLPTIPAAASFTTTPLYHGGIADLLRCWTSDAMIWLFPSKDVPITARNIHGCLKVAELYPHAEVKYFSSVPYILQMMEADPTGVTLLQRMEIVGVGGAALPAEVGDRLVEKGVNLVSRFGSAECGFLLSSYRDLATDGDWQYLRNYNPTDVLEFEPRADGLAELIIKPGWPHMARHNRADGSLATADLFAPHPSTKNAWLYHSRADSQLTLITGKKFDPAPLEDAIATSPYLADVLIFGNDRPFPGALLLRSEQARNMSDEALLLAVRPVVEKLNNESPDHVRISSNMLIPLPYQDSPLEKSSKGTIIRRAAESRFEGVISNAYDLQDKECVAVTDDEMPQYLINLIQRMTGQVEALSEDVDLFSYGVDSITCMQLRTRVKRLVPDCQDMPMSIVEDCGTIRRLTDFILRARHGESQRSEEDEDQLMLDLVDQFGSFESSSSPNAALLAGEPRDVVVLTGATGALGACILGLLQETGVHIYCLVRGSDEQAAKERVRQALEQRGLANLDCARVQVVPALLSEERLGLSNEVYDYLAKEVTSIIHVAWTVNFRLKLRSFVKDNIAGVRNLLDLALKNRRAQPPRFTYCSSTAAILNGPLDDAAGQLPEKILSSPSVASSLGYSRSKWVAEQICLQAHEKTRLRGRIAVVRVGQLAGESKHGIWNTKEAWPMLLSTARLIHCLPDLGDEPLDWLPVDIAAQAFVQATQATGGARGELPVYHVLNPHRQPTWREMLQWLQKKEAFETVSPQEWVGRLARASQTKHSALKLLGLWQASYGQEGGEAAAPRPRFSQQKTMERVPVLREVKALDEEYVGRVWDWVQEHVR